MLSVLALKPHSFSWSYQTESTQQKRWAHRERQQCEQPARAAARTAAAHQARRTGYACSSKPPQAPQGAQRHEPQHARRSGPASRRQIRGQGAPQGAHPAFGVAPQGGKHPWGPPGRKHPSRGGPPGANTLLGVAPQGRERVLDEVSRPFAGVQLSARRIRARAWGANTLPRRSARGRAPHIPPHVGGRCGPATTRQAVPLRRQQSNASSRRHSVSAGAGKLRTGRA